MTFIPAAGRYEAMHYRRTGRSGLLLPAVSLGLWHNFGGDRPLQTQRAIIRRAFDLGITHFDLANNYGPPYGSAEENFGRILADDLRPYRDELVISTKAGYDMWPGPYGEGGSRKYVLASLDQSLARMGLDYVDIFYSHRFDPDTPLEETLGALDTAVRQGKALYVGISSYSARRTPEAVVSLAGFREQGVSMQKLRKALDYVARHMEIPHPLASHHILSDGVELFWEYQERARDEIHLVNIVRGGQKVFPETVMRYLHEIEWGRDDFATRWWPGAGRAREGQVVVDPRRAFGSPVVVGTGICTEDVFLRFSAGEPIAEIADDYGLTFEQTEAALRAEARFSRGASGLRSSSIAGWSGVGCRTP